MVMKYYKIHTLRGHLGAGRTGEIIFYVKAADISKAIAKTKRMPAVKHSKFVVSAKEISLSEYLEGRQTSAYDRDKV